MGLRRMDRELHWRGVLARQAESGLNVAQFCRQESISAPSFYSWRRKLAERDEAAVDGCKSVTDGKSSANQTVGQLVPVRIDSVPSPRVVRILLPEGVAIDAPSNIDQSELAVLVGAFGEGRAC